MFLEQEPEHGVPGEPVVDLCVDHDNSVPSISVKVPNKKSDVKFVKLFILRNVKVQYLTHPEKVRSFLHFAF